MHRLKFPTALLLPLLALLPAATLADTVETPALLPEESLKKLHVREGFKAELIACEPVVLDPVAFDWDERGRLWVVEMADYPLGDAANAVICRHIHNVTYNPAENAFYACTGDHDRGRRHECHWLRGTYDPKADAWDWKVILSVSPDSRFKTGGINFVGDRLYWISDANGMKVGAEHDRGVFSCAPADLADTSRHTLLFNPVYECANMLIQDGVMLATHCAPASRYKCGIVWSPDMGKTWEQYDLSAEFGPRTGCRIQRKNSDGWFRLDLRKGWIERAEVLFIKPKGN